MEFLEFESFVSDVSGDNTDADYQAPQIQPALSLPITSNIESIGKRLTSLNNITRSLLNRDDKIEDEPSSVQEQELAHNYAKLSLELLKSQLSSVDETTQEKTSLSHHNSLSMQLSRVLNNPLSDSSIREYFSTLDHHYIDNYSEVIDSGIFGSIARKKLRGKVESEVIRNQSQILKEFAPVVKQLKSTKEKLDQLNALTKSTNDNIEKNFELSHDLNHKILKLNRDKKLLDLKKSILTTFKSKFTLNEYEEYVLTTGEINDEFFEILKKAEQISDNCSILLSMDNLQLGTKIMTKVSATITKAVDRIVSYTNKTLDNLYSLTYKHRLSTLHQCLRYLKGKLNYFNSVIANFTDSRSKDLVSEFMSQINGTIPDANSSQPGSISSTTRPIFLLAHDPIRFIGDLLAHVHSIVVNESETVTSIFTIETLDEEEAKEFKGIIDGIIDRILKSLSVPIKSKIEQLINSEIKISTIFSIYNLVELYTIMFSKQLPGESEILQTIQHLVRTSQEKISTIITNRLATITDSNQARLELNLDLQPPEWIVEFYLDILPIIDQCNTETVLNLPKSENDEFLRLVINEPIDIVYKHIQANQIIDTVKDQLILKENTLDLILSKVIPMVLLSDKVMEINDLINDLTSEMVQNQLHTLLKGCHLYDYYNVMNMICTLSDDYFEVFIYEPIKENKLFTADEVSRADTQLQEFLPNAIVEIQQTLLKLNSPSVAKDVIVGSSIEFVKFYVKFKQVVKEFLLMDLTWTDEEVATLLGIENAYNEFKALNGQSS
jgi:hypothetical protein